MMMGSFDRAGFSGRALPDDVDGCTTTKPRQRLHHVGHVPFSVHHLAGFSLADTHFKAGNTKGGYLLVDGFKASVTAGARNSATLFGSR